MHIRNFSYALFSIITTDLERGLVVAIYSLKLLLVLLFVLGFIAIEIRYLWSIWALMTKMHGNISGYKPLRRMAEMILHGITGHVMVLFMQNKDVSFKFSALFFLFIPHFHYTSKTKVILANRLFVQSRAFHICGHWRLLVEKGKFPPHNR